MAAVPSASGWEIGPIIRGKNYSVGMPLRPNQTQHGWSFEFPVGSRAAGHVHYVSFKPGSLSHTSRVTVQYKVTAAPGTRFVPQEYPHQSGTVSLFFQREGDNWSARGNYAFYRWYAPAHSVKVIAPGVHEIRVDIDDPQWISVLGGRNAASSPAEFGAALENAGRIGLVFGSAGARGHGVFATAPARFELLSFELR
jgi:hypothetical protein